MSGRTSSIILLESLLFLPAAAVVGAVRLTGSALSALQKEYRKAQEESEARHKALLERRAEALRLQQSQIDSITDLVERTAVAGQANASEIMLSDRMNMLRQRINELHNCPPEILERVRTLEKLVSARSSPLSDLIREISTLTQEISKVIVAKRENREPGSRESRNLANTNLHTSTYVKDEIQALRDKITFGIPQSGQWSTIRQNLTTKADDLERLSATQPMAARQGIAMLHQRVDRHVRQCAESMKQRADSTPLEQRHDEKIDPALVDVRAKLAVVLAHKELPALSSRAKALAHKLDLYSASEGDVPDFSSIQREANWLVEDLCARTAGHEVSAIVSHHVKDVLLTLGYKVKETPPLSNSASQSRSPTAFVTSIVPGVGVEFSVNASGQVMTEMVSLSDNRISDVASAVEESACELAERVRKGLNERGLKTQERTRYYLKPGDTLRKVEIGAGFDNREDRDEREEEKGRRLAGGGQ